MCVSVWVMFCIAHAFPSTLFVRYNVVVACSKAVKSMSKTDICVLFHTGSFNLRLRRWCETMGNGHYRRLTKLQGQILKCNNVYFGEMSNYQSAQYWF